MPQWPKQQEFKDCSTIWDKALSETVSLMALGVVFLDTGAGHPLVYKVFAEIRPFWQSQCSMLGNGGRVPVWRLCGGQATLVGLGKVPVSVCGLSRCFYRLSEGQPALSSCFAGLRVGMHSHPSVSWGSKRESRTTWLFPGSSVGQASRDGLLSCFFGLMEAR